MSQKSLKTKVNLSLSEVARGVGISPQNLHKTYIKQGKISVSRSETGKPFITLVEVLRVFGSQFRTIEPVEEVYKVETKPVEEKEPKVKRVDKKNEPVLNQNSELLAKISDIERQLREKNDLLRDALQREDWLRGQVDKLTDTIKLIEHVKTPRTPEKKPGLLSRLFGS